MENDAGFSTVGEAEAAAERRVKAVCAAFGLAVEKAVMSGRQTRVRLTRGGRKVWCVPAGRNTPLPAELVYEDYDGLRDSPYRGDSPFSDYVLWHMPFVHIDRRLNGAALGVRSRRLKRFRPFAQAPSYSSDEELRLKLEAR